MASCRVSSAQQRCVQARGDCERWLYDVFGEPQPTEAPALSGAVSGALGADVLRDDPQGRITDLRYLNTRLRPQADRDHPGDDRFRLRADTGTRCAVRCALVRLPGCRSALTIWPRVPGSGASVRITRDPSGGPPPTPAFDAERTRRNGCSVRSVCASVAPQSRCLPGLLPELVSMPVAQCEGALERLNPTLPRISSA